MFVDFCAFCARHRMASSMASLWDCVMAEVPSHPCKLATQSGLGDTIIQIVIDFFGISYIASAVSRRSFQNVVVPFSHRNYHIVVNGFADFYFFIQLLEH